MDPKEWGISTTPLQHAPYGIITRESLGDANKGKVAIVTGARRGIGAEISTSLAASGANVALLDVTEDSLAQTIKACEAHGVKAKGYACDVTDEDRVAEVIASIERDLGPVEYEALPILSTQHNS